MLSSGFLQSLAAPEATALGDVRALPVRRRKWGGIKNESLYLFVVGRSNSRDDVASDVDSTPTWPSTTAHWA